MANVNLENGNEKKAKAAKAKKPNIFVRAFKAIGKFFRDTVSEVKKVVWPSKKQVLNNTAVVLATCIICGIVLFGIDTVFGLLPNWLASVSRSTAANQTAAIAFISRLLG